MGDIAAVYLVQAASAQPLPEASQVGILTYADHTGDTLLLAALARRPDVAPEILSRLARRTEGPVRVAYLSRADVPDDELVATFRSETRAGVLAPTLTSERVANDAELTGRLVDHLDVVLAGQPTKTLAEATVSHPHVPISLKVRAIEVLAGFDALPVTVVESIRETLLEARRHDGLALRAAVAVGEVAGMRMDALVLEGLDAGTRIDMLRTEVREERGQIQAHRVLSAVDVMLDEVNDLQPEVLSVMRELVGTVAGLRPRFAANLLMRITSYSAEDRRAQRERISEALIGVRQANSAEEILDAISTVVGLDHPEVAAALVNNPAFSRFCTDPVPVLSVLTPPQLVESVRTRGDHDWTLAAYLASPLVMIDTDGWRSFTDATAAQITVARSLRSTWDAQRVVALQSVLVFASSGVHPDALCELPWPFFTDVAGSYRAESESKWIAEAMAVVQQRLRGPQQWEILEQLGAEFDGSLGELIVAANNL